MKSKYLGLSLFFDFIPVFAIKLEGFSFLRNVLANCWTSSQRPWNTLLSFPFYLIRREVPDRGSRLSYSRLYHHYPTFLDLQDPSYRQARFACLGMLVPIIFSNIAGAATSNISTLRHHCLLATYQRHSTFMALRCCTRLSRVV